LSVSRTRIYLSDAGIVSALGSGICQTSAALEQNYCGLNALQLFPLLQGNPLPVGQVTVSGDDNSVPRTHQLAHIAATQAMGDHPRLLDAIVIGTTTGGILTTEELLRNGEGNPDSYRFHGLNTVAQYLGEHFPCSGPQLTVSTACSSGAVAISIACELLQSGKARRVLAGGADSLCRLTYFGFHSLQLVDPEGARPMDKDRKGMSVAEGAAMLLLTTDKPEEPFAEIAGYGLSCDAYHPATPHPEGKGAQQAMENALASAGMTAQKIHYINLHGTGTPDNDRAECRAVSSLFSNPPPLSSIKGATGHSLAAAGAIEAVVAGIAIREGLLPANSGCVTPDPELLCPQKEPARAKITAVLSNSFGFGGNNGSLVITTPDQETTPNASSHTQPLCVAGISCLSGQGDLSATMKALRQGNPVYGRADSRQFSANLAGRTVRRLKRLSRMSLSLATAAHNDSAGSESPHAVFMGTAWGALSETHDFLARLTETREQFPSPTDFIGSVHNGAAGQIALLFKATGTNITCSGGDYSFEQTLLSASLMADDRPCFVLGADEHHTQFSSLFDRSVTTDNPADGGCCLVMQRRAHTQGRPLLQTSFYNNAANDTVIPALVNTLEKENSINRRFGLILVGIPQTDRQLAEEQLARFENITNVHMPVVDYRQYIGQFGSASALAAAIAVQVILDGSIPAAFTGFGNQPLACPEVLILGLGRTVTAMECCPP
jgi:3-oxoacyl-(acyl-carrier-protein) synthase